MRVAVVGMGPAGLRTMMILEEAGIETVGFEARDRVGGRLKTVRTEHGFYEAGGEWIDSDHHRLIELVTRLQGPPIADDQWPGWSVIRGQKFREDDFGDEINAALEAVEEEADRLTLDLDETPWMNAIYADLDDQTLGDFLDRVCQSPAARAALEGMYRSDEGDDTHEVGLLGWLCGRMMTMHREGGEMSSMRFPDGAQGFCEAMQRILRGSIHFGVALRTVRAEGDKVVLGFDSGEQVFDRAVLAIPPSALRFIRFEPGLSEAKLDAIDEARMSRTVKVALRFKRRFWQDHGLKGRLMTDGVLQQVWDGGRGEDAVLLAYLGGASAMELADQGAEAAGRILVEELARWLPEARTEYVRAELHHWPADEWAGGGFFSLCPGYVLGHWEALIRSEGKVHFAGDHAAMWSGFIEGALQSAERVAEEIKVAANVHKF